MSTQAVAEKEIWESQIPGRVGITVEDSRGREQHLSTLGVGSRMRLTAHQRELVEERIRKPEHNPFRNGVLYHVNAKGDQVSDQTLSDEELGGLFDLEHEDFTDAVKAMTEVNVRRMLGLATKSGSTAKASQASFLKDYVEEQYAVGGSTPTYEAAMSDGTAN